jgi:hypothetical protein
MIDWPLGLILDFLMIDWPFLSLGPDLDVKSWWLIALFGPNVELKFWWLIALSFSWPELGFEVLI